MLVVGAPEAGNGGRTVHVFNNENGRFVERATVTPPSNGTPLSRFGQQVSVDPARQTTFSLTDNATTAGCPPIPRDDPPPQIDAL